VKKILIVNIIAILIILLVAGGLGYYVYLNNTYITTDDVQVAGDIAPINTRAPGKLTAWTINVGDTVMSGDTVGQVATGMAVVPIPAPISGKVIRSNVIANENVAVGVPLGMVVDLSKLYILANIEETKLNDVKVGQTVDVWVDAYPNTKLTGTVDSIGLATSSEFSLLPTSNTSGTYTKVVQRVPIKIKLSGYGGEALAPGMNASIRIHK
jgi:multidrug resistance efflux pump